MWDIQRFCGVKIFLKCNFILSKKDRPKSGGTNYENTFSWRRSEEHVFFYTMMSFLFSSDQVSQKYRHTRERVSGDQIKMAAHLDERDHNVFWMHIVFIYRFHDFEDLTQPKNIYI